ncbi:MAG TPA: N-acyl homoserine lactonase family protein [Pseudomonadales bacterium]
MKSVLTAALLVLSSVALAGPKLYVFDCGLINLTGVTPFGLKSDATSVRELFVPCYLIEHSKGRLLWDTGLPLSAAGQGVIKLDDGGTIVYERSIVDQLAAMGIAPADITHMAVSHLHTDHAGGINAFAGAKVLMQKAEWDSALAGNPEFEPSAVFAKLKETPTLTIIDGDYDVFGDGSVKLIYAPGHTPGHQTLRVELEKTGPVLLSGDLYHFRESRTLRAVPTFNFDAAQTLASFDKVEALLKATNTTLWIEHDKLFADTLKKAPQYYE